MGDAEVAQPRDVRGGHRQRPPVPGRELEEARAGEDVPVRDERVGVEREARTRVDPVAGSVADAQRAAACLALGAVPRERRNRRRDFGADVRIELDEAWHGRAHRLFGRRVGDDCAAPGEDERREHDRGGADEAHQPNLERYESRLAFASRQLPMRSRP